MPRAKPTPLILLFLCLLAAAFYSSRALSARSSEQCQSFLIVPQHVQDLLDDLAKLRLEIEDQTNSAVASKLEEEFEQALKRLMVLTSNEGFALSEHDFRAEIGARARAFQGGIENDKHNHKRRAQELRTREDKTLWEVRRLRTPTTEKLDSIVSSHLSTDSKNFFISTSLGYIAQYALSDLSALLPVNFAHIPLKKNFFSARKLVGLPGTPHFYILDPNSQEPLSLMKVLRSGFEHTKIKPVEYPLPKKLRYGAPLGQRSILAIGETDAQIIEISRSRVKTIRKIKFEFAPVIECFAVSPDSSLGIFAGGAGRIEIANLKVQNPKGTSLKPIEDYFHDTTIKSVTFFPDGKRIFVGGENAKALVFSWDGKKITEMLTFSLSEVFKSPDSDLLGATVLSKGDFLLVQGNGRTAGIIDLRDSQAPRTLPLILPAFDWITERISFAKFAITDDQNTLIITFLNGEIALVNMNKVLKSMGLPPTRESR